MKYHQIGNSALEVSEIGFGCMSLEVENGQASVSDLLRKAHENGINLFDTADLYDRGINEEQVGTALNPIRDEVLIATKVGNVWREDGSGWDWNPTKEYILTQVNESLRRLQTDYIDLYMLHGGTIDDPIDDIIDAFERLKKQGKIRAYGISSIRPNTIREYVKRAEMDAVMMQYSLLDRRPEETCLDLLAEHNISVLTRGTLAKGLLVDKPPKTYLNFEKSEIQLLQQQMQSVQNPLAASVQFVLKHPAVASAVLGIRTEKQLNSILESNKSAVSEETLQELKAAFPLNTYAKHR